MGSINESLTTVAEDPLAGLALIEAARREVDDAERQLIEAARARGHGWAAIAAALGLRSRQAAEQRWLRLSALERSVRDATTRQKRDPGPEREYRRTQRFVDERSGEPIARLRKAVLAAYRQVEGPELLRQTLAAAIDAPPGALFDLANKAVNDGGDDAEGDERLRAVREALEAAMP